MEKNVIKGLIMAIVGFVAAAISQQLSKGFVDLAVLLVATLVFTAGYVVKNNYIPSASKRWKFAYADLVSVFIVAIIMAIADGGAQWLVNRTLDVSQFVVAIIGAVIGYVGKTLPQNEYGEILKKV